MQQTRYNLHYTEFIGQKVRTIGIDGKIHYCLRDALLFVDNCRFCKSQVRSERKTLTIQTVELKPEQLIYPISTNQSNQENPGHIMHFVTYEDFIQMVQKAQTITQNCQHGRTRRDTSPRTSIIHPLNKASKPSASSQKATKNGQNEQNEQNEQTTKISDEESDLDKSKEQKSEESDKSEKSEEEEPEAEESGAETEEDPDPPVLSEDENEKYVLEQEMLHGKSIRFVTKDNIKYYAMIDVRNYLDCIPCHYLAKIKHFPIPENAMLTIPTKRIQSKISLTGRPPAQFISLPYFERTRLSVLAKADHCRHHAPFVQTKKTSSSASLSTDNEDGTTVNSPRPSIAPLPITPTPEKRKALDIFCDPREPLEKKQKIITHMEEKLAKLKSYLKTLEIMEQTRREIENMEDF